MKSLRNIGKWGLVIGTCAPLFGLLTGGAAEAQTKPRVLQAGAGNESVHIVDMGGRLVVTEGTSQAEFQLPAQTRLETVQATGSGWVAAGHYAARSGGDLLLLEQSRDGIALLPTPPGRGQRFRGTPAVFVAPSGLSGAAWLEGTREDDLTVRAARWTGTEWSEPEVVSPEGPGAQLALRGATLGDGSWLLVWAAFDGEDDDIFWSRRSPRPDKGWSSPKRVHTDNQVPDVTPTVVAVPGGALIAWSWYDGRDYRIRTSRFDGSRWSEPQVLAGRGATDATLLRNPVGCSLVYRTVVPGAWHIVDFDRTVRARRRSSVTADRTDLPVLGWTEDGGPRLDWPQPAFNWPAESREGAWESVE